MTAIVDAHHHFWDLTQRRHTIVDGFRRSVHDFAPEDQARLFHDNARRIYRIPA